MNGPYDYDEDEDEVEDDRWDSYQEDDGDDNLDSYREDAVARDRYDRTDWDSDDRESEK